MPPLLLLAPLFFAFEVWQLVMGERYLGIKQIARDADPRDLGLREATAFCWLLALGAYAAWSLALLTLPSTRLHAVGLIGIWLIGYSLRRNVGLKHVLIVLTFEGAFRIALLVSLLVLAWRRA